MQSENQPNEVFYCPITGTLMKEPVIAQDGQTYEMTVIKEWLEKNDGKSPFTNEKMNIEDLQLNRPIQDLIQNQGDLPEQIQPRIPPRSQIDVKIKDITKKEEIVNDLLEFTTSKDTSGLMKVSIKAKDVNECPAMDIVAVVDRSGSMNQECAAADEKGQSLENGFSVLDIVKHSIKTVVKTLRPQDRLAVVIFDHEANVLFTLENMNEQGQEMALPLVEGIQTRGATDIFKAITEALNIIELREDKSRNPAIMMFTDGVPNRSPPEGEVKAVANILESKKMACPIHTFGFGYNLDSNKLYEIAQVSNGGMNNFIPDASMVGTIFVNAVSNILTTAAIDVKFQMKHKEQAVEKVIVGDWNFKQSSNDLTINIGSIRFGQSLDFIIKLNSQDEINFDASLNYQNSNQNLESKAKSNFDEVGQDPFLAECFRLETISTLKQALSQQQENKPEFLNDFINQNKHINDLNDEVSSGIMANLADQVAIGFSKPEFYNKWGKHYTRSFLRSLQMQIKNNFKDPGVENFGGEHFDKFVEIADDIFVSMAPPTPTYNKPEYQNNGPIDMSTYYNRGGGCFGPDSLVKMVDGSQKQIKLLKKGDAVEGGARIRCVVKFFEKDGYSNICTFSNGLQITPWHPVKHEGEWKFPCYLQETKLVRCPVVYNLVLDSNHIVNVNGTEAICLGHTYTTGILKHEYYGSEKVINDLKQLPGWNEGIIEMKGGALERKGGFNKHSLNGGDQLVSGLSISA